MAEIFSSLKIPIFALGVSLLGLVVIWLMSIRILKQDQGNDKMKQIAGMIHKGAMAFLFREYRYIGIFALIVAIVIFLVISPKTAIAFVFGAFCSSLAGYIGMSIATRANSRTAQAASKSFNSALTIAFPGGAVMGISVVSLGLLGITSLLIMYVLLGLKQNADVVVTMSQAIKLIVGFSMGASSVALFGRVGGGIYTKAADVGADLVGKVEAGIPEDDPRNPAVIADNVGDNVGDVAGMGADLFESYVGAIISALILATAGATTNGIKAAMFILILSAWGIISSIVGVFFVRTNENSDPQKALRMGMISSAVLLLIGAFILSTFWLKNMYFFIAILCGLVAGMIVGFVAEYYTSGKVVKNIAESAKTGPATLIIQGFAASMHSVLIPIIVIGTATIISYYCAGVFGIALAAIGMLSITGMTVAVDAYGPIADNAAGLAEMAGLGQEARTRAERLDAVGNTTAAIGKGFAIGSAALTALALFTAYAQTVNIEMINMLNAKVIAGAFIGGAVPFIFCAMTMEAVGRAAFQIVEEVRRQFREITGLMEGTAQPDAERCVDITTQGALKEMILPGIMAVLFPVLIGVVLGKTALGGFLAGSLITGVPLALVLSNAGGAWDNAKKHVEEGNLGGKGSDVHKATVIGDTVGDPFKDTSGPSLNILLKLMAVVSLVFAVNIESINIWLYKLLGILS
ncbi:sodium-translocating pyrophosphatase [bacterium]